MGLLVGSGAQLRRAEGMTVDLQEKRQLDLVKQAASVRARARPWRAIIFTVLAVAAAGASYAFGHNLKSLFEVGARMTDIDPKSDIELRTVNGQVAARARWLGR